MWMILVLLAATATPEPYLAACGRSPIPGPGEQIRKPLPAVRLQTAIVLPPPDGPVAWGAAHHYLGQTITVEGTIVDTHRLPSITFLNFDQDWQGKFYVVVFKSAHGADFHPEAEYLNQRLRVTGKIVLHRGRPQLQVSKLSQIEVVP